MVGEIHDPTVFCCQGKSLKTAEKEGWAKAPFPAPGCPAVGGVPTLRRHAPQGTLRQRVTGERGQGSSSLCPVVTRPAAPGAARELGAS